MFRDEIHEYRPYVSEGVRDCWSSSTSSRVQQVASADGEKRLLGVNEMEENQGVGRRIRAQALCSPGPLMKSCRDVEAAQLLSVLQESREKLTYTVATKSERAVWQHCCLSPKFWAAY